MKCECAKHYDIVCSICGLDVTAEEVQDEINHLRAKLAEKDRECENLRWAWLQAQKREQEWRMRTQELDVALEEALDMLREEGMDGGVAYERLFRVFEGKKFTETK